MAFYSKVVFPHLLDRCMAFPPLEKERRALLREAQGRVLEIGLGTGTNLEFYPKEITSLDAVEPNEGMRPYWEEKIQQSPFPIQVISASAEKLPYEQDTFDTIVTTFTLCTVTGIVECLLELNRVLKREGSLLVLEHGRSPDKKVAKWQKRLTPLQRVVGVGCHLDRDLKTCLQNAGFYFASLENSYLPKTPRPYGFLYKGIAKKI